MTFSGSHLTNGHSGCKASIVGVCALPRVKLLLVIRTMWNVKTGGCVDLPDSEMLGLAKFVQMLMSVTLEGGAAYPVVWP